MTDHGSRSLPGILTELDGRIAGLYADYLSQQSGQVNESRDFSDLDTLISLGILEDDYSVLKNVVNAIDRAKKYDTPCELDGRFEMNGDVPTVTGTIDAPNWPTTYMVFRNDSVNKSVKVSIGNEYEVDNDDRGARFHYSEWPMTDADSTWFETEIMHTVIKWMKDVERHMNVDEAADLGIVENVSSTTIDQVSTMVELGMMGDDLLAQFLSLPDVDSTFLRYDAPGTNPMLIVTDETLTPPLAVRGLGDRFHLMGKTYKLSLFEERRPGEPDGHALQIDAFYSTDEFDAKHGADMPFVVFGNSAWPWKAKHLGPRSRTNSGIVQVTWDTVNQITSIDEVLAALDAFNADPTSMRCSVNEELKESVDDHQVRDRIQTMVDLGIIDPAEAVPRMMEQFGALTHSRFRLDESFEVDPNKMEEVETLVELGIERNTLAARFSAMHGTCPEVWRHVSSSADGESFVSVVVPDSELGAPETVRVRDATDYTNEETLFKLGNTGMLQMSRRYDSPNPMATQRVPVYDLDVICWYGTRSLAAELAGTDVMGTPHADSPLAGYMYVTERYRHRTALHGISDMKAAVDDFLDPERRRSKFSRTVS